MMSNTSGYTTAPHTDVELEIRRRVQDLGKITFAEYMELALFWPNGGYYTNPDNVGPAGDFYTAPSAHPALGALLCIQAYQLWQLLGQPRTFWVVEMGAGSGILCHDVVAYSSNLPLAFHSSLRYLCIDRLTSAGIEQHLPLDTGHKVDRLVGQGVPLKGIEGLFLSNELMDSFPVHRVTVRGGELREVYVTLDGGDLVEVADSPSTPELQDRLTSLGITLPEGFQAEINLATGPWLDEVSAALKRGVLLTIDYGHPAEELYSASRSRGTVTCFYNHSQTNDLYQRIGDQDITAQVDFTSLVYEGRAHGLEPLRLVSQSRFLHSLGLQSFIKQLSGMGLSQPTVQANRMGMLDIAGPGGLGDFKVLAQGKGVDTHELWGFSPSPGIGPLLSSLPAPLLTPYHTPLMRGQYPHAAPDWQEFAI